MLPHMGVCDVAGQFIVDHVQPSKYADAASPRVSSPHQNQTNEKAFGNKSLLKKKNIARDEQKLDMCMKQAGVSW